MAFPISTFRSGAIDLGNKAAFPGSRAACAWSEDTRGASWLLCFFEKGGCGMTRPFSRMRERFPFSSAVDCEKETSRVFPSFPFSSTVRSV